MNDFVSDLSWWLDSRTKLEKSKAGKIREFRTTVPIEFSLEKKVVFRRFSRSESRQVVFYLQSKTLVVGKGVLSKKLVDRRESLRISTELE